VEQTKIGLVTLLNHTLDTLNSDLYRRTN